MRELGIRGNTVMTEGELFYQYVIEAFQAFAENHSEMVPKYSVSFESEPITSRSHAVYCNVKVVNDETVFMISISHKTIKALKAGLDLNEEEPRFMYKLRIFWIVHHEIGHWIWGHVSYYKKMGWTTKLGMFDAQSEFAVTNTPTPIDSELTHSAELLADTFAVIELFNLLSREDDGDEYESVITANLSIYAIMTTVALFYGKKRDQQHALFHPPWRLRAINILRTIFECFLADNYGEDKLNEGMRITAAAVNPYLKDFSDNALIPAWEGANTYANLNGLDEAVFDLDEKGIISPLKMMGIMTRNEASHPDVSKLLYLYKKANFWVEQLGTYSPVNNFNPVVVFGESKSSDPSHHQYKLTTCLSQNNVSKKLELWAKTNEFELLTISYENEADALPIHTLIDFEFKALTKTKRDVMDLVNLLQKDIL